MEKQGSEIMHEIGCKPLTTFVHTDTNTFREVVQRLTGHSEIHAIAATTKIATITTTTQSSSSKAMGSKRPTFKLHERRQWTRPKLQIVKPVAAAFHLKPYDQHTSPSGNSTYSLSPIGTPSKIFSKLSILEGIKEDIPHLIDSIEEDKAIKERRFYLHPSPRSMPGYIQPELLPLFPLKSPKITQEP